MSDNNKQSDIAGNNNTATKGDEAAGQSPTESPQKSSKFAVALDYKPSESNAPKVVAKGEGWLAEQIIAIAEANGIEVKEDADLAQLLSSVDVDSEIPLEAFTAVAEILSYVYKMNDSWPESVTPEERQEPKQKPEST